MEIRTLKDCHVIDLLSAFSESFSDYFVPLRLTPEQFADKLKTEKVDFNFSSGAFIDNKLAGFILHGIDTIGNKKIVYNAGTGVIPTHRKQGLTKQMYDFILPFLKREKVNSLVLEVITKNIPAIKIYEKVGFKTIRKLICYRGEIHATCNEMITIKELLEYDWEKMKKTWDFLPGWQNSINVLENLKNINKSYIALIDNKLAGYIVYNTLSKKVQQFGVDVNYRRRKIASTLFTHIQEPGTSLTIINVDESSTATNAFLTGIGLNIFAEQLEMKMELNK
jgi:ribosomal protein S18 acetylase RimI-like enzyme